MRFFLYEVHAPQMPFVHELLVTWALIANGNKRSRNNNNNSNDTEK